ncbi:hypothetical protein VIRA109638_01860 [Vibrio rarus]
MMYVKQGEVTFSWSIIIVGSRIYGRKKAGIIAS